MKNEQILWKDKLIYHASIKKKVKEFNEEGYLNVSTDDMWEYLVNYRWRKDKLSSIADRKKVIHSITPNDFFDYQRIKAQVKGTEGFDWGNLDDLF